MAAPLRALPHRPSWAGGSRRCQRGKWRQPGVTSAFQVPLLVPRQSPHATEADMGPGHETQERPPPPAAVAKGPGMRRQQRWQHQSRSHLAHQITNCGQGGGRAELTARSQHGLQGVRARPLGNRTGRAPVPRGQWGLSSQNMELRNSPCKGGEEAATFPCTQPSRLQCREQRWHPCTTTLELGQEEHPLTPQQQDVQPKR